MMINVMSSCCEGLEGMCATEIPSDSRGESRCERDVIISSYVNQFLNMRQRQRMVQLGEYAIDEDAVLALQMPL